MAQRRMFSLKIVDTDAFLDMPMSAQALYFHLGMRAENKGFIRNARFCARSVDCTNDDLDTLVKNGYLIKDERGNFEVVHWYENNGVGETARKRNNYKYRQWRASVLMRDGRCVFCGSTENLVAHHIKPFATHEGLRTDINNGITLCDKCHRALHKEQRHVGSKVD